MNKLTRLCRPVLAPLLLVFSLLLASPGFTQNAPSAAASFRPPAVPLVTHDPYFSVWSTADRLTDNWSSHWTGATQAMCSLARIDGRTYRVMGMNPPETPPLNQAGLEVTPTRTTYHLTGGGVRLDVTFLSPLLPKDLDVLARPVTYLTWDAQSADGRPHAVSLYFDATGEWAVNTPDQKVAWARQTAGPLTALRIGTEEQPVLAKAGDNVRIDWGYFYVGVPAQGAIQTALMDADTVRRGYASGIGLPDVDDTQMPRPANDRWPVLACAFNLGVVGRQPVSRHVLLAYDEEYAIELMGQRLRPYWRRNGMDAPALLQAAERDYPTLVRRCADFDRSLTGDLTREGGAQYAQLAALAYRQCFAAHGLAAGADGRPLMFPKENFSNGCISTVDVLYPSSPFFLLLNTDLLKAQLTPVLDYARSDRWKFPFAPHDLGTYPKADGQVYGGGERDERNQMPVEECGNMLLMVAAMSKADGNANYALQYWPLLTGWADYLRAKGLDPENQLCTDDFAGHLAHNTNLSLKAIEAIGAYAMMADLAGKKDDAAFYRQTALQMASHWPAMAADGDHYRLAFDRPGTWSQKYNLVWDRVLGLNLFPPTVARTEVAYYLRHQNTYGLPLDNRKDYTKGDWLTWSATLAERPADFQTLVAPIYKFADETPSRVPLTDWYDTVTGKQVGFQARSVVGGFYIKMLADPAAWKKWAGAKTQ